VTENLSLLIRSKLEFNLFIPLYLRKLFGYLWPCLLSNALKIIRKYYSIYLELVFTLLICKCHLPWVESLTLIICAVNKRCWGDYLTCLIDITRHLDINQIRYKVEDQVVYLVDFLIFEYVELSLFTFNEIKCASILRLVSKKFCDILITDFLILISLIFFFLFLFLLLLLIVTDVLDYLLNTLLVDLSSHSFIRIEYAYRALICISHEYTTKVVVSNVEERLTHTFSGEKLFLWTSMNELSVDIFKRFHPLEFILRFQLLFLSEKFYTRHFLVSWEYKILKVVVKPICVNDNIFVFVIFKHDRNIHPTLHRPVKR